MADSERITGDGRTTPRFSFEFRTMTSAGMDGVRVVVTGSTRSLGLAVATRLAARGAGVVINGTDPDRCKSVADDLGAVAVCGHVEEPGVADALVEACVGNFGGIDAVVNNAGMTRDGMLTRMTQDDLRSVLAVHVEGAWALWKAAVTAMKAQGTGGSIINVTSGTGLFGNPGQSNYAAAKGGILGLTRALSLELARFGIDVNAVSPTVKTEMTAGLADKLASSGDQSSTIFGEPDDVAALFEYLGLPASRGMTGQVLSLNGQDLSIWSHPRAEVSFGAADQTWTAEEFGAALGQPSAWQPLNPDRLGRLLRG